MSRKIKFRIWSNSMKRWLCEDSQYLQMDGKKVHAAPWSTMEWDIPSDEYVIQQFTGLYDKNKKPIYEGDILVMHNQRIVVEWGDFRITCCNNPSTIGFCVFEETEKSEIIGNIFENKELL